MAEIIHSGNNHSKNSFSKKTNRRSTRVDLTPMVDLGFLLITFFVFTTSMTEPKVMNLVEPVDGPLTPVRQSGSMTIILTKNHEIYYYYGIPDFKSGRSQLQKTNFNSIRSLILNKKKQTDPDHLMFIIKADKNSSFGDNIDLLDELSICDIPPGHYSETDMNQVEESLIGSVD